MKTASSWKDKRLLRAITFAAIVAAAAGCDDSSTGSDKDGGGNGGDPPVTGYGVERVFSSLAFVTPVDIQNAGDGSGRLFVVEKPGRIRVFDTADATSSSVFLDMTALVNDAGGEEGLLGLAFSPDYASSGHFFVYYTLNDGVRKSRVSRYTVSANPDVADAGSRVDVITFDQPYANHNGGQLAFGPDGYLYIGVGDGGGANDPENNGQDTSTMLGSILRIDVATLPYAIPAGNPFGKNTNGDAEEIWAWGLRNPWRFSFDPATGDLWCGDVGQDNWEEIDIIRGGRNYGWRIMEGAHCRPPNDICDMTGLEMPVWEYGHVDGNRSVTGGHVYRGSRTSSLAGRYICADWSSGRIWAISVSGGGGMQMVESELLTVATISINSFGVDEADDLYLAATDGRIYQIVEETQP